MNLVIFINYPHSGGLLVLESVAMYSMIAGMGVELSSIEAI